MHPKLVGVAGPSGAGKSTITKLIQKERPDILRIKLDDYFNDIDGFALNKNEPDWDVPSSLNWDLLLENLSDLKNCKSVELPKFDKLTLERVFENVDPKPIILVEGFLLFVNQKVRKIFDVKIYIEVPEEVTLQRRLKRENPDRNEYIKNVVIPNYIKYGLPTKKYANLVLDGTKPSEVVKKEILAVC